METSRDFEEFFVCLNANSVTYLVVGGYAYAVHAEPRYTKDLDIFYKCSSDNADRLLNAIRDFGFESLSINVDDLTTVGKVIQMGYPPLRFDLINEKDGVTFEEAYKNHLDSKYGEEIIRVIGKKALIKNKKESGREQDLLDAKRLSRRF